jgi:oligopeptide/dipeptide ABC transporter ATP-binding protein
LTLVGESGCGKSTLAKCLLRLVEPTSGKVLLHGQDILQLDAAVFRRQRGTIQIVFQDPYASLDPRQTIFQVIATPLRLHRIGDHKDRVERVARLLQQVGIGVEFMDRHPHELSGGQRQRVAIARALAVEPDILILDEPVSSLDMSIQAQVINLLIRLQNTFNMSYLLISHNLPLVQHISDRIAVMYLGQIVEIGDREVLQSAMLHPYTQALFSAAPVIETQKGRSNTRVILSGDVPSPIDPPIGCRFHTRCPFKQERCINESPRLRTVQRRQVACHFAGEVDFRTTPLRKAANIG